MIRLILVGLATMLALMILSWMGRLLRGGSGQFPPGPPDTRVPKSGEPMVQDPVCLTYLPKSSARVRRIGGEERYFCSDECADRYRVKEPVA